MVHSEKRTHRQRRPSRKLGEGAGGHWGDEARERLRLLIASLGDSYASFARRCGVDPPRISDWLSGDQLPSLDHLRRISDQTGVSTDWLLFGDGGAEPTYRGQLRSQRDLEVDLAVAVRRFIHKREAQGAFDTAEHHTRLGLDRWIVDGAGLFEDLCQNEERKVKAWLEWEGRTEALRGVSEDIIEALEEIVPILPEGDSSIGRKIYRLGIAAIEARNFSSGLGVPEAPNSFRGMSARTASGPVVGPQKALSFLRRQFMEREKEVNPLADRMAAGRARLAPSPP